MRSPVIIHLVHGTWPYGLFGLARKSWFDAESDFRTSISAGFGDEVTFRVCRWSGKNSVPERKNAALTLYSQIVTAIEEEPEAKHIIVAHSHGGTVAADALGYELEPRQLDRIYALVAMATPFAYVRPVSDTAANFNGFAIGILVTTFLGLGINETIFELPTGFMLYFGLLVVSNLVDFCLRIFSGCPVNYAYLGEPIDPKVPVFLLRATRDEAALSLTTTEALNGITDLFAQHFSAKRGLKAAVILVILLNVIFYFAPHANPFLSMLQSDDDIGLFLVTTSMMPCVVGLSGKAIQAIATGMPLRLWRNYRVEVDVAPPFTDCVFRSYSDFDSLTGPTMRHGIYELDLLQKSVRHLLMNAIEGNMAALDPVGLSEHDMPPA